MTTATLEHANITVRDARKTAQVLTKVFDWKIRWEGAAKADGFTVHVGTDSSYLAIYSAPEMQISTEDKTYTIGGLNHIGVVVDDLDAVEARVIAAGLRMGDHHDYEPGKRFYFYDPDGIEYEVVCYS